MSTAYRADPVDIEMVNTNPKFSSIYSDRTFETFVFCPKEIYDLVKDYGFDMYGWSNKENMPEHIIKKVMEIQEKIRDLILNKCVRFKIVNGDYAGMEVTMPFYIMANNVFNNVWEHRTQVIVTDIIYMGDYMYLKDHIPENPIAFCFEAGSICNF